MELHEHAHEESETSFVPDAYDRSTLTKLRAISGSRRRWRLPAMAASLAVVAALCLHTGSASARSSASSKAASTTALSLQNSGATKNIQLADSSTSQGGVHGALNFYDGVGGGVEFWFNPSTGELTIAVGVGIGEADEAVLGTYTPGTEPEAGDYFFADASLDDGTVGSFDVSGTYSIENNVFSGTVTGTVDGMTVSISSDGTSSFTVGVTPDADAVSSGFTGIIGVQSVWNFNFDDWISDIWNWILSDSDSVSPDVLWVSDASDSDTEPVVDPDYTGDATSDDDSTTTTSDDDSGTTADDSDDDSDDDGGGNGSLCDGEACTSDPDSAPVTSSVG